MNFDTYTYRVDGEGQLPAGHSISILYIYMYVSRIAHSMFIIFGIQHSADPLAEAFTIRPHRS